MQKQSDGSRRRWGRLGACVIGVGVSFAMPAVLASGCTEDEPVPGGGAPFGAPAPAPCPEQPEFAEPEVIRPGQNPVEEVVLRAKGNVERSFMLVEGDNNCVSADFYLSMYNESLPGPTLELRTPRPADPWDGMTQGDALLVKVTNEGDLNRCYGCTEDKPPSLACPSYCPTTGPSEGVPFSGATNIHTHGLHMGAGFGAADPCHQSDFGPPWDNILVSVPSTPTGDTLGCGEFKCQQKNEQQFIYPLPPQKAFIPFHPADIPQPHWFGLQWYHPHNHVTSQDQLRRGLAGAIIIRNAIEADIPVLAQATERLLVLQRMANDNFKALWLVNGLQNPRMKIKIGETQRWRVVNAAADEAIKFSIQRRDPDNPRTQGERLPFYTIGHDGVPLPKVGKDQEQLQYRMASGNRLEFLFRAPEGAQAGDVYNVVACRERENLRSDGTVGACYFEPLATLEVEAPDPSAPPALTWPPDAELVSLDKFGLEPDLWASSITVPEENKILIEFQDGELDGTTPYTWKIDGKEFHHGDECSPPHAFMLGQVYEITVRNHTSDLHAFHIHVNPFQLPPDVVDGNIDFALDPDSVVHYSRYQDTILTPRAIPVEGGTPVPSDITFRMRPVDFPGTTVLHCHMLRHEDNGMMQPFTTCPPPDAPCPASGDYPPLPASCPCVQ